MTARQSISVMTEYSYALRVFARSARIPTDEREGREKEEERRRQKRGRERGNENRRKEKGGCL